MNKIQILAVALGAMIVVGAGGILGNILQYDANQQLMANLQETFSNYEDLQGDYEDLLGQYEQQISDYEELLGIYVILSDDNDELQEEYDSLLQEYNDLMEQYNQLLFYHSTLQESYNILLEQHVSLQQQYNELSTMYEQLEYDYQLLNDSYSSLSLAYGYLLFQYNFIYDKYDLLRSWIGGQIYPQQLSSFAEAIRRYYLPIYLGGALEWREYWENFTMFVEHVILHDSYPYNKFGIPYWVDVRTVFNYMLTYGSSNYLTYYTMRNVLNVWTMGYSQQILEWGDYTVEHRYENAHAIYAWVSENIEYEYDDVITDHYMGRTWDYIKFSSETVFRTKGDCEDQVILLASFLESCGFNVAIGLFHDVDHPTLGHFNHAIMWLNIDFNNNGVIEREENPTNQNLWTVDGTPPYWILVDPTWNAFGSNPIWLDDYVYAGRTGPVDYADYDFTLDELHTSYIGNYMAPWG